MKNENLVIENAQIRFRNFEGKEGKFNPAGRRNFCVLLDNDQANQLREDGWNIKYLKPRDPEDKEQAYMQVSVGSYEYMPPNIYLVSSKGKNLLTEEELKILDWADISYADLIIRPYNWEMNGKTGIKAYVKTLYVTITEDELEHKYSNTPDSAENTVGGCGDCDACEKGEGTCPFDED